MKNLPKLKALKSRRNTIVNAIIFLMIFLFLIDYYKPSLMLSETITSGGDTASDYYPAKYMVEQLLPKGEVAGWSPGWYGGFPMLQFYFPLPFIFMAILSIAMPLQVAFKLVSALGVFLLPLAVFIAFRAMKFSFPVPAIGAIITLPFLFMEANSMWGGNIPSTLAGEFSYGISFALSIIFLGLVYSDSARKHWIRNGLLFALIVFSHIITAMWIVLATSFFLLGKNRKQEFVYFAKLYILAFLLLGAWLLPLITNMEYTTSYADTWNVEISQIFPVSIAIYFVLLLATLVYFQKSRDRRIFYLAYACFAAFILFILAEQLGVVNIRFAPFMQLGLLILGATGFMLLKPDRKFALSAIIVLLFFFIVIFTVAHEETTKTKYIAFWIKWNYEGFEGKAAWSTYKAINDFLEGDQNQPRVVYEHSDLHDSMGTPRAFESLPLFSGRSTLEGLFMQSSPTAPFVFYIQSEVSEQQSCPFWRRFPCTQFNLDKGTEHLKLFNVQHYIVRSDKAKAAVAAHPEYRLVHTVRDYQIYELTTNENRYVTVPQYEPVLLETNNWKRDFYEWFKNDTSVHLVYSADGRFSLKTDNINNIPKVATNNNCNINEKIENEKISFTTDCIGKPHIIRISYFPLWRVSGADKIYLVSPSFMLVYPTEEKVTLYYGNTFIDNIGMILTITGFALAIYFSRALILNRINSLKR